MATAAAGPVGVRRPGVARRSPGASSAARAPPASSRPALVGALSWCSADLVARRLFAPTELPVGVITAVVGAPYLLWLLARANKIGTGG